MDTTEWLGIVAGILTTTAFLPQAIKTWSTNSAKDLSLPTLMMIVSGVTLWTVYGILRDAPSVWAGNGTTMILAAFILSVKLRGAD